MIMSTAIFTLQNLQCRYPGAEYPVLEIDNFTIHRGELVFFLGVSGVGKSTLIESLGLMNRTIVPSKDARLTFHGENGDQSLFDLWNHRPEKLAKFRSERYSFIFQNSNLFEKLSLADNAIMPAMANSEDVSSLEKQARELSAELLKNVSAHEYDIKSAGSISGGQKQRLAFIQAIISPHEVLFGDEPTGNLDWGNAKKVMTTLRQHIKDNQKTGLVVSHDVPLSVAFADRIVLLTEKENTQHIGKTGVILSQNVFARKAEAWVSSEQQLSNDHMTTFLKSHFEKHAS
jgi:ABC-type lipoprotein export system ATPase subunit